MKKRNTPTQYCAEGAIMLDKTLPVVIGIIVLLHQGVIRENENFSVDR